MIDVFLEPIFDSQVNILGLPLGVVSAAFGVLVALAGLLWFRRITQGDAEPRIFRATTRAEPTLIAARIGVVAFAAIAILVFVAGR